MQVMEDMILVQYIMAKNIALAVVLKVGKLLEANPKVDVIYTKKTDIFVDLVERANIMNRANAHFPFIVTLIEILLQTVPKPM
jgi:N-acetylmuramoyl-L-alanine amidase